MRIIEKMAEKSKDNFEKRGVTIAFLGDSVTQGCFELYINENGEIVDANGGDITSSVAIVGDEGEFAPLTGVLLDSQTGEAVNSSDSDDSPY